MSTNEYVLGNKFWELKITKFSDSDYIYKLHSKINDVTYADQDYYYNISTSGKRGLKFYADFIGQEKRAKNLASRTFNKAGESSLIVEGRFSNTDLWIKQEFILKANSKWLSEFITITNRGNKKIRLASINFGFKKMLYRQFLGWENNLDEYTLTKIPTRRFFGQEIDRKKENFSANDLIIADWFSIGAEMPGFCSEGWLWGDSKGGLLICKYNISELEFSRFSRLSMPLPGRGCEDVAIIFGGVALCQGNPELATLLDPGQSYTFGVSKYAVYEGEYKNGYYLYRSHLNQNGHTFQKNYDPPINWNELYNLGWKDDQIGFFTEPSEYKVYTLEDLYHEAVLAQDIGAECLYLDPGWNTFMGSEIWNKERFGSLNEFSKKIHEKYGLKLGLHLMMNFASENEPDEFYLRSKKGVRLVHDPYLNIYCVCANDKWVEEKSRRILELGKAGVDFLMFDFTTFSSFLENNIGCCNRDHGHEVPMRRQTHAQNIFRVIQNVKKVYPNIIIEAHDRGVGNPLYFQHGLPHSFDENWGFEYMWNPMHDLVSLKALSLYEYNLAYSIPLYLHINENSDNENMVQFWWYSSVVRHIGIGGLKDQDSPKYKALKNAILLYKKIKPILTRGIFYGISPMIHLHVDEDTGAGVLTAFNLTSRVKKLNVKIDPLKFNLKFQTLELFDGTFQRIDTLSKSFEPNKTLEFEIELPSLSPAIAILK